MAQNEENQASGEAKTKPPYHESDLWLLSYLVEIMLPYSRRGKNITFDAIMNANGIKNFKIPVGRVERLLIEENYLFWRRRIDWEHPNDELPIKYEYRINPNRFFTLEERSDPNYDIDNLAST